MTTTTADETTERPELIFRPTHGVAIVYLRRPAQPEAEIAYLKDKPPAGVDIRIDHTLDYVLLKPDASTLRQCRNLRRGIGCGLATAVDQFQRESCARTQTPG